MFDADLQLSRDAWPEDAVRSGELEIEDDVDDDDDIIFLLSPTNTVSIPVIEGVGKLVNRVGKRPVILLNPRLADVPSHGGVMQVTGRADRLTLLDSFEHIFFLKLLFKAGTVSSLFLYPSAENSERGFHELTVSALPVYSAPLPYHPATQYSFNHRTILFEASCIMPIPIHGKCGAVRTPPPIIL